MCPKHVEEHNYRNKILCITLESEVNYHTKSTRPAYLPILNPPDPHIYPYSFHQTRISTHTHSTRPAYLPILIPSDPTIYPYPTLSLPRYMALSLFRSTHVSALHTPTPHTLHVLSCTTCGFQKHLDKWLLLCGLRSYCTVCRNVHCVTGMCTASQELVLPQPALCFVCYHFYRK